MKYMAEVGLDLVVFKMFTIKSRGPKTNKTMLIENTLESFVYSLYKSLKSHNIKLCETTNIKIKLNNIYISLWIDKSFKHVSYKTLTEDTKKYVYEKR